MNLNSMATHILSSRYIREGEQSIDDVFRRVVNFVGRDEKFAIRDEWMYELQNGLWMPSSPILMNAGTPHPMLSACFVLDIEDDMTDIFNTLRDAALIQQHGGGVGFNFSKLRESGATVWSTNGVASGVVSFMRVFNEATNVVKQGGRRRGACIALLDVDHPDIMDFINCKNGNDGMNAFNLSVRVTDDFMEKANASEMYDLHSRADGSVVGRLNAGMVLNAIVKNAVETGDPGIIFADNIEKANPTPWLGPLTGVNPCGEVSLYDMEACNLASINLEAFADDDSNLAKVVKHVIRFLDDTIDVNVFPVKEVEEAVKRTRKVGLGITGLHGYLIRKGIQYDSTEGFNAAAEIMKKINDAASDESYVLGFERGAYPATMETERATPSYRNATRTCIAPTGTVSLLLNTSSSGIEPIFSYAYNRKVDEADYTIVPPIVDYLVDSGKIPYKDKESLYRMIEANGGSMQGIAVIPEEIQRLCHTAYEVTPIHHVAMLSEVQRFVDNNISKTINIPSDYGYEFAIPLIEYAHKRGCRGVTLYRDGSRNGQVLTAGMKCPVCGGPLHIVEGCRKCPNCGWSACVV